MIPRLLPPPSFLGAARSLFTSNFQSWPRLTVKPKTTYPLIFYPSCLPPYATLPAALQLAVEKTRSAVGSVFFLIDRRKAPLCKGCLICYYPPNSCVGENVLAPSSHSTLLIPTNSHNPLIHCTRTLQCPHTTTTTPSTRHSATLTANHPAQALASITLIDG